MFLGLHALSSPGIQVRLKPRSVQDGKVQIYSIVLINSFMIPLIESFLSLIGYGLTPQSLLRPAFFLHVKLCCIFEAVFKLVIIMMLSMTVEI